MWFLSQLWDKDGELRAVDPGSMKEGGYSNLPNKTADAIFSWRISIASLQLATYGWQIGARKLMYSFKNPVSHQCHVLCILYIVQLRISVTSPLPRSFLHTFCDIPHAKVSQLSRPHQKMLVLSSDAGRSWGRRAGEHVPSQQPPAEVIVQFHASDFSGDWTRSWSWPRQNVIHWYSHLSNVHSFMGPANIFLLPDGVGVSIWWAWHLYNETS